MVSEDEERILWEKNVLSIMIPFPLQFTLWFYTTLLMGFRGGDKRRSMCFGDLKIKTNTLDVEYIEMRERGSKTRDGEHHDDMRPTIFCSCASQG